MASSKDDMKDLIKETLGEVMGAMKEEERKKREEEKKKREEEKEKKKAEAEKKKKEEQEAKKKKEENRQKSIEGKKRKREERANEERDAASGQPERSQRHWLSQGAVRIPPTPAPSGSPSDIPLPVPQGFPLGWIQEYLATDRQGQREIFDSWAPGAGLLAVPDTLSPLDWRRWVRITDPRDYPALSAESRARQFATPAPAPAFTFRSAPQQQSYAPTQQRNPQRGGRADSGAGRANTRFAGQSRHENAEALKRQQALSSFQSGALPPLTPSFTISTGPAIEKGSEKEEEMKEPEAKKRRRGKGGKGNKPAEKPTEEVAAKPAEGVASGVAKGEDTSMADVSAPSAEERAVREAETLRSRNQALEQDIAQRGLEATRRDNDLLRLRLQATQLQGQITTRDQRITSLEQQVTASRQAEQQFQQQVQEAQQQAEEAQKLAQQAQEQAQNAQQQVAASALDRERAETRRQVQAAFSRSVTAALREMSELLGYRVQAAMQQTDTRVQDALINNLGTMISQLEAAETEGTETLNSRLSDATDAALFGEFLASAVSKIQELENERTAADEASRSAPPPPPPNPLWSPTRTAWRWTRPQKLLSLMMISDLLLLLLLLLR